MSKVLLLAFVEWHAGPIHSMEAMRYKHHVYTQKQCHWFDSIKCLRNFSSLSDCSRFKRFFFLIKYSDYANVVCYLLYYIKYSFFFLHSLHHLVNKLAVLFNCFQCTQIRSELKLISIDRINVSNCSLQLQSLIDVNVCSISRQMYYYFELMVPMLGWGNNDFTLNDGKRKISNCENNEIHYSQNIEQLIPTFFLHSAHLWNGCNIETVESWLAGWLRCWI